MASRKAAARVKEVASPKQMDGAPEGAAKADNLELLDDLPLTLSIELGRSGPW